MELIGSADISITRNAYDALLAKSASDEAKQIALDAAKAAAEAGKKAEDALVRADGTTVYFGDVEPSDPKEGDLWFVYDANGEAVSLQMWDGTDWVDQIDLSEVSLAIQKSEEAKQVASEASQSVSVAQEDAAKAIRDASNAVEEASRVATIVENAEPILDQASKNAQSALQNAQNALTSFNDLAIGGRNLVENTNWYAVQSDNWVCNAWSYDAAKMLGTRTWETDASTKQRNISVLSTVETNNAYLYHTTVTEAYKKARFPLGQTYAMAMEVYCSVDSKVSLYVEGIKLSSIVDVPANTWIQIKDVLKLTAYDSEKPDRITFGVRFNPVSGKFPIGTIFKYRKLKVEMGNKHSDWTPAPEDTQVQIDAVNGEITQKVNKTDFDTLSGKVTTNATKLEQTAYDISLKADKSYVDAVKGTVDSQSTLIKQNSDAIALTATKSSVDTLSGRVTTAESTLVTQANKIATMITATDADKKYATQSSLTQTSSSLSVQIASVQGNLDKLSVGGLNMALNSSLENGDTNWRAWGTATESTREISEINDLGSIRKAFHLVKNNKDGQWGYAQDAIKVLPNTQYTISFLYKGVGATWICIQKGNGGTDPWLNKKVETPVDGVWTKVSYTWTTSEDTLSTNFYVGFDADGLGEVWIAGMKMEKGNIATDWSPATDDVVSKVQFSSLQQTVDGISTKVSSSEGVVSNLVQTSNLLSTQIARIRDAGNNLVIDSTFDNYKVGDVPSYWTNSRYIVDNPVRTGINRNLRVLELVGDLTANRDSFQSFWIPAREGQIFSGSFQYLTNGVAGGDTARVILGAHMMRADGTTIQWPVIASSTNKPENTDWIEVSGTIKVPAETTRLRIFVSYQNAKTTDSIAYVDNLFVKDTTYETSQITQLIDNINLRVSKNDIINQINISTEGILLDGKKIRITGDTYIENGVIKTAQIADAAITNAKIGNIDAGKITAGTISSDRISARSITADKLSVTSLAAVSSTLGTVYSGNIYGSNLYIGGNGTKTGKYYLEIKNDGTMRLESPDVASYMKYGKAPVIEIGNGVWTAYSRISRQFDNMNGTYPTAYYDTITSVSDGVIRVGTSNKSSSQTSVTGYPNYGARSLYMTERGLSTRIEIFKNSVSPGVSRYIDFWPGENGFDNADSSMRGMEIYSGAGMSIVGGTSSLMFSITAGGTLSIGAGKDIDIWGTKMTFNGSPVYVNGSGGGTLSASGSLSAGGIASNATNLYLGAEGEVRVTNTKGYNNGGTISYVPIKTGGVYSNYLETRATNLYLRPSGTSDEVKVTASGTTDSYADLRCKKLTQTSSYTLKQDIKEMERSALDIIDALKVYEYRFISEVEEGNFNNWQIGLISEYSPQVSSEDGKGIDNYKMTSYLWQGARELYQEAKGQKLAIEILTNEKAELENKVSTLEDQLANVLARLEKLENPS